MKITHVTTRVLSTPADNPLVVGLPTPTETREFVTLELGTDQGLVGLGLTFFGGALTAALRAAVEALAQLTVGEDPARVEAIVAKLRRAAGSSGPGGIFTLALSAIDLACWDLRGKAHGRIRSRTTTTPGSRLWPTRRPRPSPPASTNTASCPSATARGALDRHRPRLRSGRAEALPGRLANGCKNAI
jgi:hypothetical protein